MNQHPQGLKVQNAFTGFLQYKSAETSWAASSTITIVPPFPRSSVTWVTARYRRYRNHLLCFSAPHQLI